MTERRPSGTSTRLGVPRQRLGVQAIRPEREATAGRDSPAGGVRGRVVAAWRRYVRLSVAADPMLSTVWIQGHCLDVSIYDRDWPESYRY